MISVKFDRDKSFQRQMNNLISYSQGFLEGAKAGLPEFSATIGEKTKEILEQFIDSNARTNPDSLHHVYEWYQTGSPTARLFDISYIVRSFGLSFSYGFSQSQTVSKGSREPFYDKAKIMEEGIGVTIAPKKASVLVFEDAGKTVFTKNPVRVENPGGRQVQGSFDNTFEMFFTTYFRQSFLRTSGLSSAIGNTQAFTQNIQSGMRVGRPAGTSAGLQWIKTVGLKA